MGFLDYLHSKEEYSLTLDSHRDRGRENLVQRGEGEHLAALVNHCDLLAGIAGELARINTRRGVYMSTVTVDVTMADVLMLTGTVWGRNWGF